MKETDYADRITQEDIMNGRRVNRSVRAVLDPVLGSELAEIVSKYNTLRK